MAGRIIMTPTRHECDPGAVRSRRGNIKHPEVHDGAEWACDDCMMIWKYNDRRGWIMTARRLCQF